MPVAQIKSFGNSLLLCCCILLWFSMMTLHAQEMSVLSFQRLEKDMDARVSYPQKDRDGEVAALIKVVTTETGFEFDGGLLGIVKIEPRTSEYWVYVPRGAAAITIKHPRLGVLRDYAYPLPIEKATVYEMKLVTGRLETKVIPLEPESQWVVITTDPSEAMIYLNDRYEGTGSIQKKLPLGSYTYRIELSMYHTEAGKLSLVASQRAERQVKLRPSYGFVEVVSTPEAGAKVLINNQDAGFVTKGKSGRLQSGEYTVTVVKDQYQPASQVVTVKDEETTQVTLAMSPNFAQVSIKGAPEATLYIDDTVMGKGDWEGRLGEAVYTFEARQDKHSPAREVRHLKAGEQVSITLTPIPRTGSLDITSKPPMARVYLNGTDQGTAPLTLKNLLVGEYSLSISAPGYGTHTQQVEVKEGPPTSVHGVLPSGMEVSIKSDPPGARLRVGGKDEGNTPVKLVLGYGSHKITLTNESKVVEDSIMVREGGKMEFSFAVREFSDPFEGQMVFVEGSFFFMGCTPEQGKDCENDEKPSHRVSLGDYYIGKYEVTQRQWRGVMGNNPSNNKGCDDCPVENVSWDEVQEFIRKLNQFTGKQYRLPTEAEWEYAARGGNQSKGYRYSGSNTLSDVGYFYDNSESKTQVVGSKQPNELGLHDMSGNVWEWCSDWYGAYSDCVEVQPEGPFTGAARVLRGGSWYSHQRGCRVSNRGNPDPQRKRSGDGFRLVLPS